MRTPIVLFLIFLVLKLAGIIAWSWWLVTAPLWGWLLLVLALSVIFGLIQAAVLKSTRGRFDAYANSFAGR